MRSQLDVRLGAQEPVILHQPPDVHSLAAADEAIELADAYLICDGNPLAESQRITLRNALGERVDGSWAATQVADFGPRQGTGKNDKIAARELAGLMLFGEELIIHTAHEFPTANESFLRLVAVFEAWDDLRKKVARIRYANGEQGIELLSGQRLKYRARTGGSGRGFAKADLLVYDEAQHLGREHLAASGPAKLANPNSQSWYAGSGGLATSLIAWDIRRAALKGDAGRLAYTEATAERVELVGGRIRSLAPDPGDVEAWYRAMPGLGRWVSEEGMWALYHELGPELFARECLCVWEPPINEEAPGEIDMDAWSQLAQVSSIDSHRQWALAVSPDRKWASLGVAGRNAAGRLHVEWREHRAGTGWVVDRCVDAYKTLKIPLRVVASAAEGSFIGDLRERGVEVDEVSAGDEARATGRIIDAVASGELVHLGQPSLDKAVRHAVTRTGKSGAKVWDQSGAVEISPLRAVTVALGGVAGDPVFTGDYHADLDEFLED